MSKWNRRTSRSRAKDRHLSAFFNLARTQRPDAWRSPQPGPPGEASPIFLAETPPGMFHCKSIEEDSIHSVAGGVRPASSFSPPGLWSGSRCGAAGVLPEEWTTPLHGECGGAEPTSPAWYFLRFLLEKVPVLPWKRRANPYRCLGRSQRRRDLRLSGKSPVRCCPERMQAPHLQGPVPPETRTPNKPLPLIRRVL